MDANVHTKTRRTILGLMILGIAGWNFSPHRRPPFFYARGVAANHTIRSSQEPGAIGANLPIAFEPNLGQTADQVKFFGRASGYRLFIEDDETVIILNGVRSRRRKGHGPGSMLEEPRAIRIKLLDANPSQKIDARDQLPGHCRGIHTLAAEAAGDP